MELSPQSTSNQPSEDPGDEGGPSASARCEGMMDNGHVESVGIEWTSEPDMEEFGASSAIVAGNHPLLFRGRVYRRIPPGPHIPVTSSDGTRVYLKMRPGGDCGKSAQPKVLPCSW